MSSPETLQTDPRTVALEALLNKTYAKTKIWAGAAISLQVFLFVSGISAVFFPCLSLKYPLVALPLALIGIFIATKAAKHKGLAEKLKRVHEYCDGYGKPPSGPLVASLSVDFPENLRPELNALLKEGITYASDVPAGTRRVLENLSESAWFSQHLAGTGATLLAYLFGTSLTFSVWLLYLCSTDLAGTSAGIAGAQSVATTLLFLISVGLYRSWTGYRSFSALSEKIDSEARRILAGASPDACEALRLLTEYQVARAGAPLIPTWIWRIRRKHLNRNWALHTARN